MSSQKGRGAEIGPGKVTFETKCWEADWRRVLSPGLLEGRLEALDRPFDERVLLINNVESLAEVARAADPLVSRGILTSYLSVEASVSEAMGHFGLGPGSLGAGYWYSSAELVGLLACRSEFLLHFASDAGMGHICDWVTPALQVLADDRVVVVSPVWNGRLEEAALDRSGSLGPYWLGFGFSDQCYLVKAGDFLAADLNLDHPASARYPAYGGALFERRVDSWMRCTGLLRAVDVRATYVHPV